MTTSQGSEGEWGAIGERIRTARETSRMSVRELARRVGVSASHVSQVERGLASFSVRTLYNVVSELDLSMDSLFDDVAPASDVVSVPPDPVTPESLDAGGGADPLVANGIVLRRGERPALPLAGGTRWERLTPRPETGAEFIEVVYPPAPNDGTGARVIDFIQHSSREYGLVLSGSLTVQVGFETTVLHAGDSIAFNSVTPHRFWNETDGEVRAVWFIWDSPRVEDSAATTAHADLGHLAASRAERRDP